jgi:ribosomal protein S18 acetylase RimI-like enzyme
VGTIRIRPARPGDGRELADLHRDTSASLHDLDPSRFRLPDSDGMSAWIDGDLATAGEDWICLVAEEDGHIVGQVEAKLHPPMDSARYQTRTDLGDVRGEVNSLGVRSTHRRRGIGRALMTEAEEWLKTRGARVILLDTFLASPESIPFYDAIGYNRTSVVFEKRI